MKNNKFWNWVKNEDTNETELLFNGPISEDTWFGDEITPAMFRNELSKVNGNLTVCRITPILQRRRRLLPQQQNHKDA